MESGVLAWARPTSIKDLPLPTYSSICPFSLISCNLRHSSSPQSTDMAISSSGAHLRSMLKTTSSGSLCRPIAGKSPPGGQGISCVPSSFPFLVKNTGTILACRPEFLATTSNLTPHPTLSPASHLGPNGCPLGLPLYSLPSPVW